jgi:phosphoglycerate kinase
MKRINEVDFKGKNIIIRCDYNVPLNQGVLSDEEDDRIEFSLDTIKEILNQRSGFVLLISHLGRPEGKVDENLSLKPVQKRLQEYLGYLGISVNLAKNLEEVNDFKKNNHRLVLLENIRFWPEEKESNSEFAEKIAEGFDIYVNNAFPVSHRDHASITKIPEFCAEKCAGNLFIKEIENLTKVKESPQKPAVAIIGGAKIETKLPVIQELAQKYDFVLVGGKTANEALDKEMIFPENVLLPVDFAPQDKINERLDIGPKTQQLFIDKINQAKTIVWNGPLGLFEQEDSSLGTQNVIRAISRNQEAFSLVGGGETISALNRFGNSKHFDYVSMSGGAMLDFLADKELPGIKALQ